MFQKIRNKITHLLTKIGKRQRFILASGVLASSILFSSFLPLEIARYFFLVILLIAYLMSFVAIPTGLNKIERVMLFLLPIYFTIALDLFFFFLPGRWLTRIPFIIIYVISIYAILLSSNILNIGAQKSLQLLRAAFSVNFLFLTFCAFLICNLILSFRLNFFFNFIAFFIALFPLSLQFLWSVNPKSHLERVSIYYALFIAFIIAQIGLIFSFLAIKPTVFALLLTACFYSISGLFYAYLEERLFKERIREFVFVLGFVLVIILLSVRWT
ncbi:MAG TPA: hypothetical protein VK338_02570 [Candidatus Nitrosocosmicus sp.]|nr:hypothetical protein [Candidatus Nitrosocosmicus sp.]